MIISIHALLAESDTRRLTNIIDSSHFYPRSPCGERPSSTVIVILRKNFYPRSPCGERRKPRRLKSRRCVFLSTLSLRRATNGSTRQTYHRYEFLSTLSLRRATTVRPNHKGCGSTFLSTLSLRRATTDKLKGAYESLTFLSTLSLRRATIQSVLVGCGVRISIHALLAESDVHIVVCINHILIISIHALLAESDAD